MNRPKVAHYDIKGTGLELLDIIKSNLSPAEYQAFLWASLEQYAWRWNQKGDAESDLDKLVVYATWLLESVREHGVCMGKEKQNG